MQSKSNGWNEGASDRLSGTSIEKRNNTFSMAGGWSRTRRMKEEAKFSV